MSSHITAFFGVSLAASSGSTNDYSRIGEQVRGPISKKLAKTVVTALAVLLVGGCATSARQLMPTPTLYQFPGGQPVFDRIDRSRRIPDLDPLFITDRAPPTPAELDVHAKGTGPLPYGQGRVRHIAFGSARVSITPALDWNTLREQSQLAERTQEVNLELSQVRQLGVFPEEPYRVYQEDDGRVVRDRAELARHFEANPSLTLTPWFGAFFPAPFDITY